MAAEINRSEQPAYKKTPDTPEAKAEQLREDIARTRSALSQDMRALGERLNPDQLKEDAKEVIHHATDAAREGAKHIVRDARNVAVDSLREAKNHAFDSLSDGVEQVSLRARQVGHDVSDFVAAHAVPLTLLGAGAGWLLLSMSHQRRLAAYYPADNRTGYVGYREGSFGAVRDRAEELTNRAGDALARTGHQIAERAADVQTGVMARAGELRSQVAEGASQLGHQAVEYGRQAYDGLERAGSRAIEVSERNPLTIGLLALAAGAAVAMLLPPTRRENQLLGRTRDQLVERAQRSAEEVKNSVQRSVNDVREVIDEIRQPGSSHA